jgi:hypothetical protein
MKLRSYRAGRGRVFPKRLLAYQFFVSCRQNQSCPCALSTTPWRRMRKWRYSSTILGLGISCKSVIASRTDRFTPGEEAPGTRCVGGWMGFKAGLDTVEKRNMFFPWRESNPGRPARSPSLYQLSYRGSVSWSKCSNNGLGEEFYVFWVVRPSSPVKINGYFVWWTCQLHRQSRRLSQARNKYGDFSSILEFRWYIFLRNVAWFLRNTLRHIPEDTTRHCGRCENHKSNTSTHLQKEIFLPPEILIPVLNHPVLQLKFPSRSLSSVELVRSWRHRVC